MSEFHGDVSGRVVPTYLPTYESGITEGRERRAEKGQRKTSLFPEHFTPFPPAGACCRSLKGRIRVRRLFTPSILPPSLLFLSSLSLYFPLSSCPCPLSSSLSPAPCTLLSKHSVIPSSLLLRFSENLTLENFRLPKIFVSSSILRDLGERPKTDVIPDYFVISFICENRYPEFSRI